MLFSIKKLFVVVFCLTIITACNHNDNSNQSIQLRNKVVGKLFDVNTLTPVTTAEVKLWIDDQQAQTIHTSDGSFSFDDVPNGRHRLEIESQGYATIITRIFTHSENDNDGQLYLGDIGLTQETQLAIAVSDEEGNPINGGQASVISIGVNNRCATNTSLNILLSDISNTVQIENGQATFFGLNQCEVYKVIIPSFDIDSDGIYDFESFMTNHKHYNTTWGLDVSLFQGPLHIVLSELSNSAPLSIIHVSGGVDFFEDLNYHPSTRTIRYQNKYGELDTQTSRAIGNDEEIKFFFSSPVEELEPITANYKFVHDTTLLTNPIEGTSSGASIKFNAEKTIMTISPPTEGYTDNQVLDIQGIVISPRSLLGEMQELEISEQSFITPKKDPQIDIVIDNGKPALISSLWLDVTEYTITKGSEDYTDSYLPEPILLNPESMSCTTCNDTILAVLDGHPHYSSWPLSNVSAGDQVTISIQAKKIDQSDIFITQALAVKGSIAESALANN